MNSGRGLRDFWLLWSASTISNLGDGIRFVALPLLAISITTDPLMLGAITASIYLPWFLFSLPGGAIADRHDRRKLILVGQSARAVSVAGFAILIASGQPKLASIYLIAFIIGTGEVVVDSAMQAAIPRVAGPDLDTANSRFSSAQFVAQEIAGGPVGAVLFTASSALPFVVDAASFGIGAILVGLIATPLQDPIKEGEPEQPRQSIRSDIAEGGRFLWNQPVLRGLTAAVALSNLAGTAVGALLILLVIETLQGSKLSFGLVFAVGAVGGFLGAALASRVVQLIGRRRTLVVAFLGISLGHLATAVSPTVSAVAASTFLVLFCGGLFNVSGQSIRQRLTPNHLLGRVIASMRFVSFGAAPLGGLIGGLVARGIGVRPTIALGAALGAVATIGIVRSTAGHDLEAEPIG